MPIAPVYRVQCNGPCRRWLSLPDDYQPGTDDLPLAALVPEPTAARAGLWPDETAARRAAFAAGWSGGTCPDCAAARPDSTTPAVGDRYDSRDGGAPVTVTRLWNFHDGGAAVTFEWPDAKPVTAGDTLPLDEFHRDYQPARPDNTTGA